MARTVLAGAMLAALMLSGCATTRKIGQIKADPTRYRDDTVRVKGRVTNSFGALVAGFYEVEDETGKIYVISRSGVPSKGVEVSVKGTVMNGITVMGKSFGTAIQEQSHKVQ
jgi:hypothetical protein